MHRISRGSEISVIGLTETDVEERLGVAVGWVGGEVLPPFSSETVGRLSIDDREKRAKQAEAIRQYREGRNFYECPYVFEYADFFKHFGRASKVVEVIGGITQLCVAGASEDIADKGPCVLINPHRVIAPEPSMPAYWIARIMIRDLLSPRKDFRCFIRGEDLFFYKISP